MWAGSQGSTLAPHMIFCLMMCALTEDHICHIVAYINKLPTGIFTSPISDDQKELLPFYQFHPWQLAGLCLRCLRRTGGKCAALWN